MIGYARMFEWGSTNLLTPLTRRQVGGRLCAVSTCSNASKPHTVYELWAGDRCLYVGHTCHVEARLFSEHRVQTWNPTVTKIVRDEYATKAKAAVEEARRIRVLNPERNQHHVLDRPTPRQQLTLTIMPTFERVVMEMLLSGASWRAIAKAVNAQLPEEHGVSHETLRQWFTRPDVVTSNSPAGRAAG